MKAKKVVVFGGRLDAGEKVRVTGFTWKIVDEAEDVTSDPRDMLPPISPGEFSGVGRLTAAGLKCDVGFHDIVAQDVRGPLYELLEHLLSEAIRSLLDYLDGAIGNDTQQVDADRERWADDEEYARVKREVESTANAALDAALWAAETGEAQSTEPICRTMNTIRRPYHPEMGASVSGTDSRTVMGFRTAQKTTKGAGVKIAVLDTGCRRSHPAIPSTVRPVIDCTGRGGGSRDDNGHGTFVVSQIVGIGPASDPIGTATECEIIPLQVLDSSQGWGADSWIARGVDTAVRLGADVISMSLGGDSPTPLTEAAIKRAYAAGIVIVVAAGNAGYQNSDVGYPARYAECISVGACDDNRTAAGFSQGQAECDTWACGVRQIGATGDDGYGQWDGTSMATPHVAAAVAMFKSCHKSIHGAMPTIADVAEAIADTDEAVIGSYGRMIDTSGLIKADAMLLEVRSPSPVDPTPAPTPPDSALPVVIEWVDTRAGCVRLAVDLSILLDADPSALVQFRRVVLRSTPN